MKVKPTFEPFALVKKGLSPAGSRSERGRGLTIHVTNKGFGLPNSFKILKLHCVITVFRSYAC